MMGRLDPELSARTGTVEDAEIFFALLTVAVTIAVAVADAVDFTVALDRASALDLQIAVIFTSPAASHLSA